MEKKEQRMRLDRLKESRIKSQKSRQRNRINIFILCSLFLIPLLMASSCKTKNEETTSESAAESNLTKPDFSADSAYLFIKEQLDKYLILCCFIR